ncbi:hypothetical protein G6F46_011652 [Rhizopus delemar]|uniref:Polar growth protein n=3 Tax=Rhizopus TaxID=4842 RepID=I1BUX9_RHIO9|nr:hypothetical protein RO3G_04714 [Rhizopus delemar RA 99-880]KAG1447191.1 hypothetical protein G6F55_011217 [Rhizopus delemar]KAG1552200.1 hypothetical protein G6F51_001381 [Rhizopus arrhizus]KAG1489515.1 hypothetical protein G6F54_011380 [Rhizopus delemar]KAG1513719.1 hypothetical protein G6F52_010095 [Rhizopus delemar]|eukprot:EIE80009.1 hypothetical protein RO3G_04714 [Rhizopus delemar RA 99-880]
MSTIVYAVHNFEAENEDEINFSVGEPIVVLEKDEKYLDGWWQGRNIKGETGLFPMNYTSPEKPQRQYMFSPHSSARSSGSTIEDEIDDTLSRLQIQSTKVEQWDTEQVAEWLNSVGFSSVAQQFVDQEITGDILLELNIDALKELGINTFGKRYKIMQAITALKESTTESKLHSPPPPAPNPSLSTGAILHRPTSRASSQLRRSSSQRTTQSDADGLYQFPRKAPLPPTASNRSSEIETGSFLQKQQQELIRPPSPQSLSSSSISRSNTYNTVSSAGSRTTKSRELSPDPKSFRTLSQKHPLDDGHSGQWLMNDLNTPGIHPTASRSTPKQPMQVANTHTLSVSPFEEPSNRASEAFQAPEHEGWLHKQSDKYKTWNKRWFVLKGTNLFYFKSPKDVRMKGIINLRGYRIIVDESIHAGKYCFKAQHELERTFYFYTDSEESMRIWLKMLMKTTIARDFGAPVMSSNQIATVPLDVARRMRPRPPSVIMYQKQPKSAGDKRTMPVLAEDAGRDCEIQQADESGITHPIIPEEEEEIPDHPYLTEEEDLIDPQHRSLPLSSSHQSMTSSLSEEDDDDAYHWNAAQYVDWINAFLPPGKKVIELTSAFRNGDTLILLLEAISQKTVQRPPAQKGGSVSVMMLDNIVAAFKFMGREGVEVDGRYTIKDVFGGNEEKIMTMLDSIKAWADVNHLLSKKSDTSVIISEEGSWRGSAMMDHRPQTEDGY